MKYIVLEIIFEWIIKKIATFFWRIGKKFYKSWKKGREKSPSPTINGIIELEKCSPLAPYLYLFLLVDSRGLLLAVSKAPKSYRHYILLPQNTRLFFKNSCPCWMILIYRSTLVFHFRSPRLQFLLLGIG